MAKENKKICYGQKVSIHVLEVLTHEDIRLEFGYKVSTHRVKVSTPKDSEQNFKFGNISVDISGRRVDTFG